MEELQAMGIEVETFPDYTGLVGIPGRQKRENGHAPADIDGLPMEEHTGLPFAATNGKMHACVTMPTSPCCWGRQRSWMEIKDELEGI